MLNVSKQFDAQDFCTFLQTSNPFVLELSRASVTEVIDALISNKRKINVSSAKGYEVLKHSVIGLEFRFGVRLMPSQVTDIFWEHFVNYLYNERNLKPSSISTICAELRSALAWGAKHGAKVSSTYDDFSIPKFRRKQVALTPHEVSMIYTFDVRNSIKWKCYGKVREQRIDCLTRTKDMFVLSCCLGQRHSDMIRITKDNFERNIFSIVQQKTGNKAIVDIDKFAFDKNVAYEILEKYNYEAPYKVDISSYNKQLHVLFKQIGFNDNIVTEYKQSGVMEKDVRERWKAMSSHTARRTFASINILDRRYSEVEVRRATGHTSSDAFDQYICFREDVGLK